MTTTNPTTNRPEEVTRMTKAKRVLQAQFRQALDRMERTISRATQFSDPSVAAHLIAEKERFVELHRVGDPNHEISGPGGLIEDFGQFARDHGVLAPHTQAK
jgi:hypothetical protein